MDLIETLRQLGGVKRCPEPVWNKGTLMPEDYTCSCGIYVHPSRVKETARHTEDCPYRSRYVLDLAPLLSKPIVLEEVVSDLLGLFVSGIDLFRRDMCIVGPQHASNLVYEVSRQLGGTAVVAESVIYAPSMLETDSRVKAMKNSVDGYRLTLPIPPDATVLFVFDRFNADEMLEILRVTKPKNVIGYILALVSDTDKFRHTVDVDADGGGYPNSWRVVALRGIY